MKPSLRLSAALLAAALQAGCTAGLGEQPTVTEEAIPATAETSLTSALAGAPAEDADFYWPAPEEVGVTLLEPAAPQMDKQTAANNAAALFDAAGLTPENGTMVLALMPADAFEDLNLVGGTTQQLWADVDAVYAAAFDTEGFESPALLFDAITGKAYLLLEGDAVSGRYDALFSRPADADSPTDPRYAQAADAANAWVEQVCADPVGFLNQLLPLLGWQAASVESCGAYAPWPDSYGDYFQQAEVYGQLWPYLLNIRFTTTDGRHFCATWDPMLQQLQQLICQGAADTLPEGYQGDTGDGFVIRITPGQPVFGPCYNYALQGGDGIWREVTCMEEADWQTLWAEQNFSTEKYMDILYWRDPAAEQAELTGSYRPLSDGFPTWDPAGQTAQLVEEVEGALEQAAQP